MQTTDISKQIADLSPEKRALLALRLKKGGARHGSFPLSYAQERLWFIDQLEPGSPSYNTPGAWRVGGPLDVGALERALNELTRRHEILRTNFLVFDGTPMQVVNPPQFVPLEVCDLSQLPPAEREAEAARIAVEEGRRPFDLGRGPLTRTRLLRLAADEHILLRNEHHIINDGMSQEIFLREVATLYDAYRQGHPSPLAELPIQYGDYAVWQRGWLQGEVLEEQLAYWRRQLGGALPALDLPTDRPRPAVQSFRGAVEMRLLSGELAARLKSLGHEEGASLFMTLLTAFNVLLLRYTNETDLCVGTPVLNRDRAEIESLMGYVGNTLVLRTDASGDPTFRELLRRVRRVTLDAFAHQHVPFERVVRAAQPERSLSRTPLFQVMFTLQSTTTTGGTHALPGLTMTPLNVDIGTTHFDITLSMEQTEAGLGTMLQYDTDLFDAATIRQMLDHLERLLAGIADDPDRPLSAFELLSEAERAETLYGWNETAADYPRDLCIHQLFERQVASTPDAVALVYEGEELTYSELDARANRLARHLRALGVGPEILVGVCAERSLEMVVGLLGILKAGGAYVPLDPNYPAERLAFMLEEARVSVLLTQQHLAARLEVTTSRVVRLDADWPEIAARSAETPESLVGFDNLAYVIYTSGSTGRPKGAMNTHGAIHNRLVWMQEAYGLTAADRVLQKTPYSFDVSVWEFFWPLMAGARLVVARPGGHRDTDYLARTIRRQGITTLHFVPSMLYAFLADPEAASCTSLKRVFCSGEALSPELEARFFETLGAELHNLYGPTEAAVDVTYWACRPDAAQSFVPIGRPVANTQMYVLDERLRPVVRGGLGELYIGGVQLARGYLSRPDLTAERFIPDPFGAPGARLYRTGDLARHLRGGAIKFVGRADHQVKLRGARIELGEIETALAQAEGVREAAVIVREDVPGDQRLTAYLVAQGEPAPTHERLRALLSTKLPDYMIPAAFIVLPAFPLTASGKLDRRALPAPDGARPELLAPFVEPRTEAERTLCDIWAAVLRVERVGVHDNFFDLGGDSILSIQVVARANRAGLRLLPRHLFQHQTVAALAAVAEAPAETAARAEQGLVTGPVELTPIQRWFFEQRPAEPHHFNQAIMLEVSRPVDARLLERVVASLLEQHDALRLRYAEHEGVWGQVNDGPDARSFFTRVDLSGLASDAQRQAVEARAAELQAGLDLARGPVFRVALFDLGPDSPSRILLVAHHLVVDGVSWRILLDDLARAYEQAARGERVELGPKTTSFQEWARLLARHAQSGEFDAELDYWASAEGARALPVDHAGGENAVAHEGSVSFALSAEETRALLRETRGAVRAQAEELLLAALVYALDAWTGDGRFLIDLESHGRAEVFEGIDLSRTVGWFTSLYPVLFEAAGDIGATLRGVKERMRAVPRRGLGYGALRYLRGAEAGAARLSGQPRAEVVFNYLGQLDTALDPEGGFAPARESVGPTRGPRNLRSHLLDVSSSVAGGRLRVAFAYGAEVHERTTVEALAASFRAALRELLERPAAAARTACTPADFPLAKLDERQLGRLLAKHGEVEDIYALSPLQQGILFHSLYESGAGVYLTELTCELRGGLDVEAFASSWRKAVARHAILRTCFEWDGLDEPVQLVRPRVGIELEQQDWRADGTAEPRGRFAAYMSELREQGVRLDAAPLMRLTLIRTGEQTYLFAWHCHHLLLDGWSVPLLLQEVFALYEAERQGREPALPAPRPFRDYIAWLQEQPAQAAEAFWREALAGVEAPTPFRVEKAASAPPSRGPAYGEEQLLLARVETTRLRDAARRCGVTMNTLVQGAWALLLSRYGGARDVVFGVTSAGRPAALAGVEQMVGMFINTLPARVRVADGEPVADWLACLQRRQSELRDFEYSTLAQIQGWSGLPRGTELFESILIFENYPSYGPPEGQRAPLEVREVQTAGRTGYPITVLAKGADELLLKIWYDRSRFEDEVVARMLAHLRRLLLNLAADPERALGSVELLSEAEREQLLSGWNGTAKDFQTRGHVHQLIERQVRRTPEAVAVSFEGEHLTYAELNSRANQLAHRLRARGVGPEVPVGVLMERSTELVVSLLAVLKAGGAYVPFDPSYPAERLRYMIEDAAPPVLLTQERLLADLPAHDASVFCVDSQWDEVAGESTGDPNVPLDGLHPAYIIYTSGSTGRPKGAVNTHLGFANRLVWMQEAYGLTAADRVLQKTPYSFDVSAWEFFWPLMAGARLVVARPGGHQDGDYLVGVITEEQITALHFVPSMLQLFLASAGVERCDSLRLVISSGEALPAALVERFHSALGAALHNLYGPTEASIDVTAWECVPGETGASVPIGRPVANTQIYLLDDGLEPVPVGVPGELYIGGVQLARGYLKRPALTADRFIPHPHSAAPGARLYRTGDLARYGADGRIEYLGRLDDQVKVRGQRIELGEIEAVLRQHPSVRDVTVMAQGGDAQDKRLVAYVVSDGTQGAPERELRAWARTQLADFMVPAQFVGLAELPLSPSGKVDRRALLALGGESRDHAAEYVAPQTVTEETLAAIWAEVFRVERVGREDNFFDLGGHSLMTARIVSGIREAFGVELPFRSIFETETLAALAARIDEAARGADGAPAARIPRVRRDGETLPLSFAQQRLWFLDQLEPNSSFYNIPAAVRLTGQLDVPVLERTFTEIVRRHEVLRTTFALVEGQPVQVIKPELSVPLWVVDLTALPAGEREAEARRLATAEAQEPFDLAAGPLLRVGLLRLSEQEHVALITMHHIVSDGWSAGVLVKEVAALYDAYRQGRPSPLAELPIQYADYAAWQRDWLSGEVLEGQLDYWRRQLSGLETLELPTDRPRPPVQTYRGASQYFHLPAELSAGVNELSRREGVTPFILLLAAFNVLLHRYTGQEEVTVGTPVAGRNRAEVEGLIGFFVNTLVLRTDLSGAPTFRELLRRAREVSLGAYAHQDVPFEKLVEVLQPERELSRSPLFQVMFEMQNRQEESLSLSGLVLSTLDVDDGAAKFDLTLLVAETGAGLTARFEYNTDLFDAATVERMGGHFQQLLVSLLADPSRPVADVPMLTEAERQQILVRWNSTAVPYPHRQCADQLFAAQAARTPDRPAVVCEGERLTYAELNRRANRLAHLLRAHGVGPEVPVGVFMERGTELLVAFLAILKAGGVYVPLDPNYPTERLLYVLSDARAAVLLTQQRLAAALPEHGAHTLCVDVATGEAGAGDAESDPPCAHVPGNLAYVIYTSGSTGRPKGAMVTHAGMLNHLVAKIEDLRLGPQDSVAQTASQSFDISIWQFLAALVSGGRVEIFPDEVAHHPARLFERTARGGVTILETVPALLRAALDDEAARALIEGEPGALRWLLVTGEALPPELCRRWLGLRPAVPLLNAYGPTECSDDVAHHRIDTPPPADAVRVPVGRPVANTQLYVLDRALRPVPIGVEGELCVGGVGVGRGYLRRPELTAERFVPDPFSAEAGARLYRTGDRARLSPGGEIEFLGRLDRQVKVRGFRIELEEIEAQLCAHDAVSDALVLVGGDGSGAEQLFAFVVAPAATAPAAEELRERLKGALPEYMIPAAFVVLEAFPLTPNGKVDRNALTELAAGSRVAARDSEPPRTPVEEAVAEMWAELLGREVVGRDDNFFDLGGHSLLAIQLVTRLQKTFKVSLALRSVFEAATVAALSERLAREEAKPGQVEKIALLLRKIRSMSVEERQRVLRQKRSVEGTQS
ncbi:MAG: amino acid adenylation domain-containing protein [Acidobacteria bacterium]|nr:amino acid adenylation domain-containing protein [Acidobacteriota bacterium]